MMRKMTPMTRWLMLLIPAAVFFGSMPGWSTEPVVSRIDIRIMDWSGETDRFVVLARKAITMEAGRPFSADAFDESLDRLRQSGLFQKIHVPDPDWDRPEILLAFELTPFYRIKDIQIEDAFPILEREVLSVMTIAVGDPFIEKKLTEQERLIRSLFEREGFPDPQVTVRTEQDPEDRFYTVEVKIQKGDYFWIRNLDIEGNRSFSNARLKMRMSTWYSGLFWGGIRRFEKKALDEDVKGLRQFYRGSRYPDAGVVADVNKDPDTLAVDITVRVTEDARYDITFEGNEEFWDMTIDDDLVLFKSGNASDIGLRRSLRKIRERYEAAGYLSAEVRMVEEDADPAAEESVRPIHIIIEEGARSIVKTMAVTGNNAFDADTVKDQMLTRTPGILADGEFVPETLEDDKAAVKTFYETEGYLATTVDERLTWHENTEKNRREADLALSVVEGPRTRVAVVAFEGLTVLSDAEALELISLTPGSPYQPRRLSNDETALAAAISEKGHPHVKVTSRADISEDGTAANIRFAVAEGPFVRMGKTYIIGNFKTAAQIIRNELSLEPGEPFSLRKMLESQRDIRNINAFNAAYFQVYGLEEKADEVDIVVAVEEKKPYFVEFGGGYDTARELFVHAKVGDRNLFGRNINAWIGGEYSTIGYRADAGVEEPRFLATRVGAAVNLFLEDQEEKNQNFGTRNYGASLTFNRKFLENRLTTNLSFAYERRDQYRTDDSPIPPVDEDQYEPRSVFVTTPAIVYNSTDSFIRPTRGIILTASTDISTGLQNSLDDFFKYRIEMRYFRALTDSLVLAMRGRYGYIDPWDSDSTVPDDQLFYLGGTGDVRGFDENSLRFDNDGDALGGRTEILGSLEARIELIDSLELITFYDVGSIRDALVEEGSDDFRSSIGAGLAYRTPIGPIGLFYGHKVDRKDGESAGRFHFTFGYTF